jgi:hypothetical protein
MNELRETYITIERHLFPMLKEEFGELTAKQEFVHMACFIGVNLRCSGIGRPMSGREGMLAFILKAVYDFPTTKVLIENLETNPSLRRLCGREYRGQVPRSRDGKNPAAKIRRRVKSKKSAAGRAKQRKRR